MTNIFANYIKADYDVERELSLEKKKNILHISSQRFDRVSKMKCKELSDEDIESAKRKCVQSAMSAIIECDKIVGIYNCYSNQTWGDIFEHRLHKPETFEKLSKYGLESFEKFLLYPIDDEERYYSQCLDGWPAVIEKNGEYYIYGNGTHRLTIAKFLGGLKANVALIKV